MAHQEKWDRTYWLTCASVARSAAEELEDPLMRRELDGIAAAYERIARLCVMKAIKEYDSSERS
jgi:hypothetical protein